MTPIAPDGYGPLPNGERCRCAKLWKAENGSFWCCKTGVSAPAAKSRPRTRSMRLVIIESPYAAVSNRDLGLNVDYARAALRDALMRGESPIASHLLLTQPRVLQDALPEERALGIAAGQAWRRVADISAFYTDRGWSPGMLAALESAADAGAIFELRSMQGPIQYPDDEAYARLAERGIQTG